MKGSIHLSLLGAAVLALGAAALADQPASNEQLLQKINELQAKVQQLEANQKEIVLNTKDVDATVNALVRDADNRTKLMADNIGFLGGWDNGFHIRSQDGNFDLHPRFQLQVRNNTVYREPSSTTGEDLQNGFEIRRMRIGFDGCAFTPKLKYLFEWDTAPENGGLVLQEAWVQYEFAENFAIRGGQMKDPLDHEQILTGRYQLAAERSLLTDLLAGAANYVQGVSLLYNNGDNIRAQAAFTDGFNSANTNFEDYPNITPGNSPTADWGAAARFEYKLWGKWSEYDQLTGFGNTKDLLVLGAGVDWTEAGNTDMFTHVVDIQWANTAGLCAYAKYIGRWNRHALANGDGTYDWGAQAQISWAFNKNYEVFARYDYIHLDSAGLGAGVENNVHEITVGLNYYLYKHSAKFTIDLVYLPNGSPVTDLGSGVLSNNGKNELLIRGQFQLML